MATKVDIFTHQFKSKQAAATFAGWLGILLFVAEAIVQAPAFHHDEAAQVGLFSHRPQLTAKAPRVGEAQYEKMIHDSAQAHRVELALVKAIIRAESGFNPSAVSRAGARGLMQLMPHTARKHGVRNAHDPRENVEGGVKYLRSLLDRFNNNLKLTLAAYNAGTAAVKRYRGLPPYPETRSYVARVLEYRQQYLRGQRPGSAPGRA